MAFELFDGKEVGVRDGWPWFVLCFVFGVLAAIVGDK